LVATDSPLHTCESHVEVPVTLHSMFYFLRSDWGIPLPSAQLWVDLANLSAKYTD